jgi:hypothetical protein
VHNTHFLDPSSSLPYLHHPPSFQLQLQAGDFQPFAPRTVQVCVDIEGLGPKAMHPAVQFPKSTWMGGTPSNNSIEQTFSQILNKLTKNCESEAIKLGISKSREDLEASSLEVIQYLLGPM